MKGVMILLVKIFQTIKLRDAGGNRYFLIVLLLTSPSHFATLRGTETTFSGFQDTFEFITIQLLTHESKIATF